MEMCMVILGKPNPVKIFYPKNFFGNELGAGIVAGSMNYPGC